MDIKRMQDTARESSASPLYVGDGITRQALVSESKDFSLSIVNFPSGNRSKWHDHDCDQVLIVTGGSGIVATDGYRQIVEVGDIVFSPAGEKHWHGAGEDHDFSHITITVPGSAVRNLED
ncbi:MAG: cupin domain-containing protein [Dehalococcoidia bacterium]|nr:cupin domain-containing protein [Dehalococcoidia bacterium]